MTIKTNKLNDDIDKKTRMAEGIRIEESKLKDQVYGAKQVRYSLLRIYRSGKQNSIHLTLQ